MAVVLGIAAIPFVYYCIVLFSSWRFFGQPTRTVDPAFAPPVSILKPFRGLDPDAYENLASFCRQDYPDYELVLCVDPDDGKVNEMVERVKRDFPRRSIRVLPGSGRVATNDKVAKLARMVAEASHEIVVISDSDVRVRPDYLRAMVAPLEDPKVGAVTCFYVHGKVHRFIDRMQTAGMLSDFYAGILVAWQLDGIKFALGPSIATTRSRLAGFGGYAAIENRPADDLLVGRLIAEQGYEVRLLRYSVHTVSDYHSMEDLFRKRLRWIVVMRHMRPAGHFGLLFTHGLPWALLAVLVHPTLAVAAFYLGGYALLRAAILWTIGARGLDQADAMKQAPLIPVWDAVAFVIWLVSFTQTSVRWRGADYYIRDGQLVPVKQ
jgi:ceramide glucosyltransferase